MKFYILFIKFILILIFNYCIAIDDIITTTNNNNTTNTNNEELKTVIENNFETKMTQEKSPSFRLLNILAHPEHFIFPEQNSFYNKTELIYAIEGFAESTIKIDSFQEEIKNYWLKLGGEQIEIINLINGIKKMIENIQLEFNEQKRTTLLVLYSLGCNILEDILKLKTDLKTETDKIFAYGLDNNFKKVIKVLSGLNPSENISLLNELIENPELLDKLANIGSKVSNKYSKSNEPIFFDLIISNEENAEKMSGQLLTELIDNILTEVSGKDGTWGYVKSDNVKNEGSQKTEEIEIIDEKKEKDDISKNEILVN